MALFRTHLVPPILAYVAERGGDVAALVRACSLPADAAERAWIDLPLPRVHELLDRAARAARDEAMGINVGLRLSRSIWDVIQVSFLSAPDLRAALHRIARLAPLFNDRAVLTARDEADGVVMEYRIEGEPLGLSRHGNELILAVILGRARDATGDAVRPRACWVAHPRPANPAPLVELARSPDVSFGAGATGIRL